MNYIQLLDEICFPCGTLRQEHEKVFPFKCLITWDGKTVASGFNFSCFNGNGKFLPKEFILARARKILNLSPYPSEEQIRAVTCMRCGSHREQHSTDGLVQCQRAWHGGRAQMGFRFEPPYKLSDLHLTFLSAAFDYSVRTLKTSPTVAGSSHVPRHNCQCGSWVIGVQDYEPGHTSWCPVHNLKGKKP